MKQSREPLNNSVNYDGKAEGNEEAQFTEVNENSVEPFSATSASYSGT